LFWPCNLSRVTLTITLQPHLKGENNAREKMLCVMRVRIVGFFVTPP